MARRPKTRRKPIPLAKAGPLRRLLSVTLGEWHTMVPQSRQKRNEICRHCHSFVEASLRHAIIFKDCLLGIC